MCWENEPLQFLCHVHTREQAASSPTEPAELDEDGECAPRLLWQQRRREPELGKRVLHGGADFEGVEGIRQAGKEGREGARGQADGSRALRDDRRAGRRCLPW